MRSAKAPAFRFRMADWMEYGRTARSDCSGCSSFEEEDSLEALRPAVEKAPDDSRGGILSRWFSSFSLRQAFQTSLMTTLMESIASQFHVASGLCGVSGRAEIQVFAG
jgi:hypothetical protein